MDAARGLIRETGDASFSMRALAARAGLCLATPYNLFGSKRAIILAVVEDGPDYGQHFAAVRVSDPIDRMFAALELTLERYLSDPCFHKTLWRAVFDADADVRPVVFNSRRRTLWRELIAEAIAAGALEPRAEPERLELQFDLLFRSGMHAWATGEIGPDQLGPTMTYGLDLLLRGAATPPLREHCPPQF